MIINKTRGGTSMFSNPLKQAAEEYLYTNDSTVRERTEQQLVRAGTNAVAPLIDALILTLRKLKSSSWGKSELLDYADTVADLLGAYADQMREEINAMPNSEGDGMSMAQATFSREACHQAWQVISQIGESGVRALFTLINGRDKRVRLAAMLALNSEENPNRFIINSLMTSAPYLEPHPSEIETVAGLLVFRIKALSGDQEAKERLDEYGQKLGLSGSEFANVLIDKSILLLAK
jgi:hypothetical protein